MARRWYAVVLVGLVPAFGRAERLPVRRFTTDGLGDNVVHRIARGSRGYLWSFTREGLSRARAVERSVHRLLDKTVRRLVPVTDGEDGRLPPEVQVNSLIESINVPPVVRMSQRESCLRSS